METNKTILMREVVSIGEKKTVGAVKDILVDCDGRSVSHFVIGDFEHGAPRLLPYQEIRAVGNSFITIDKEANFLDPESRRSKELLENGCKLVGVEVFSGDGDRVGAIGGFNFDPKNGGISSVMLNDGTEYPAERVLFFSPKYVFVDEAIVATATPEPAVEPQAASVEPIEKKIEEPVIVKEVAPELSDDEKLLYDLLVGKKVNESVKSDDGDFTLEKDAEITEEVFLKAAKHDALLALTASIDA